MSGRRAARPRPLCRVELDPRRRERAQALDGWTRDDARTDAIVGVPVARSTHRSLEIVCVVVGQGAAAAERSRRSTCRTTV